jgi:glycosyltransferase involved in cell wall biosynthesis
MDYNIVIATRNRPEILAISVPLMLSQSRRPRKLIVVDSSDDADAVKRSIERSAVGAVDVELIRSKPGLTHQRNVGLRHVTSDVVMYPDDDSLWLPTVAESIMRVYERDDRDHIGAVCAAESTVPPEGVIASARAAYHMSARDQMKLRIGKRRNQLENRFVPDPFMLHGRSRWSVKPTPAWLADEDAVLVEWMTGFRMSFRTDIIRRTGFDETFGNYGQFEDVEASFQVLKTHLLVGARRAKVFHYRSPVKRAHGRRMGACQVLDRAYIVSRHSPEGSAARQLLPTYCRYKAAQYLLACHTKFGRDRFKGAIGALRRVGKILQSPPSTLSMTYLEQLAQCTLARA